ncbi:hypothetical protein [Sphingobacterium daejeonense]|jgi:t-SNARE complex subunit (syntaxin)|uniref:hypothetical protein n=1 Tax=Sphingobacterium daejeonense TaxID=371142 RepID=UPI0010C24D0A|nr:hypothetical protein [Sphingobacterium daejeonense]VTP93971.1 Uncharacterised protein [Sphingobacterium daejeonense]
MAKKLSELLAELSQKAKQLEDKIAQADTDTHEQLQEWEEGAKTRLKEEREAFEEKTKTLKSDTKAHWESVKTAFEKGVGNLKQEFKEAQYDLKAAKADFKAEWAEEDAETSVYFALSALADAEQDIIKAIKARKEANKY